MACPMKSSGTHIRLGLSRGYYHTWLCIALATRSSSWVAFSQSTSFWLILLDFAVSHLTLHYCTWLCIAHVTCSSSWAAFSLSTSFWPSCTSATPNSKKVSFLALLGRVPTLVAFLIGTSFSDQERELSHNSHKVWTFWHFLVGYPD
jgi:hypothetical protein